MSASTSLGGRGESPSQPRLSRALWPVLAMLGVFTLAVVRASADYSIAGDSLAGSLALVVPGFALGAVGLITWARRPSSRCGPLLLAGGLSWWLPTWANPDIAWALPFTLGLVGWALCPAVVAHGVLTYPDGDVGTRTPRLLVAGAYANSLVVLGIVPALTFDPVAAGCVQCPDNLVNAADLPTVTEACVRFGRSLGLLLFGALAVVILRRLVAASPARRRLTAPVGLPGVAYLGLVAAGYAHKLAEQVAGDDAFDRGLWVAQGVTLTAVAAGVAWAWLRAWRTRSDIARLVLDLAAAPPAGGLQDVLAQMLGDDTLRLAYPLRDGELVDAHGQPFVDRRPASTLAGCGRALAVITHRPGLLDDPATAEEVAQAATLVLENERLHAELAAQLAHLRDSRRRIVAAGDEERRRLERDLHDGAQQALVTLLLRLRLTTGSGAVDREPGVSRLAVELESELELAVADLRGIAHGIFPAVLADEGLAEAVDAFAEGADIPVAIVGPPEGTGLGGRLDPTVEGVAYFVVAESIERSAAEHARVSISRTAEALALEVDLRGVPGVGDPEWLLGLQDRVGALDGSLDIVGPTAGHLLLRAEIPCAS